MNTTLQVLLCVGVSLSAISCTVTYGNKDIVNEVKLSSLKAGKVTVHHVYEQLGQPSDADRNSAQESHWIYRYRAAKNNALAYIPMGGGLLAGGKDGDVHRRDFYFDSADRLIRVEHDRKALYTSNLFSLGRSVSGVVGMKTDSSKRVKTEMERLGKKFNSMKSSDDQLLEKSL